MGLQLSIASSGDLRCSMMSPKIHGNPPEKARSRQLLSHGIKGACRLVGAKGDDSKCCARLFFYGIVG